MSKFETVAVPFETLPDGRKVITDLEIAKNPWLLDFIKRFEHCFERSNVAQFYIYKEHD